jgi:hypothetical protein
MAQATEQGSRVRSGEAAPKSGRYRSEGSGQEANMRKGDKAPQVMGEDAVFILVAEAV